MSHFVWVVGPLSGLIVAPIVGTLSDRCTHRMGRRRPFIVGGLIATIVGMLTFSNAPQLASLLVGPESESHHASAIAIAIVSFCILDLAINTTMWPGWFSIFLERITTSTVHAYSSVSNSELLYDSHHFFIKRQCERYKAI